MSKFKVGDTIANINAPDRIAEVCGIEDYANYDLLFVDGSKGSHRFGHIDDNFQLVPKAETVENNAVSPNVYKFPKAEVRDISAHLSSFGGQAVQYVARATRLDGLVKGNPVQDIEKAIQVLQWELERMQEVK